MDPLRTPQVDVWGMGCVFAELVTGNPFFPVRFVCGFACVLGPRLTQETADRPSTRMRQQADTTVNQLRMIQQHGGILDGVSSPGG